MYIVYTCPDVLFFFNDTAPTEIYTLSLHDALPIFITNFLEYARPAPLAVEAVDVADALEGVLVLLERSEEHTSELQSPYDLVCRLLLEKKNSKSKQISGRRLLACQWRPANQVYQSK